jgi:transposase
MKAAGLAVELLEKRHVRDAFKAMPVKTDRTDARGIAQLMRLGWFRSVDCKSLPAQELRAILTPRKLVQSKRHDLEMSLRGILRGFGSSKATGAHFGLTPREKSIWREGRHRTDLQDQRCQRAHRALGCSQRHPDQAGQRFVAEELGDAGSQGRWMRKAKVALARKLAVVLHRMLVDRTEFVAGKAAAKA